MRASTVGKGCPVDTHTTCDTNAECTDSIGSYTCACSTGYTGDGTSCDGTVKHLLTFVSIVVGVLTVLTGALSAKVFCGAEVFCGSEEAKASMTTNP